MDKTQNINPIVTGMMMEMRRGVILLAVLSQCRVEQYGYSLMKSLADKGLEIDQGTLYPLLRRLESQGLLSSSWRLEDARPRRYYQLNLQGEETLRSLEKEWESMVRMMQRMLEA